MSDQLDGLDGFDHPLPSLRPRSGAKRGRPRKPRNLPRITNQPEPRPENPEVTVNLQFRHSINGIPYGPGPTEVRANLARSLLHQEQLAREEVEKFHATDRAFIIVRKPTTGQGSHGLRQVPAEGFDETLGAAAGVSQVSGRGMEDPGVKAGAPAF